MLRIAMAKGRLSQEAVKRFKSIGMGDSVDLKSRKLVFRDEALQLEYLLLKPSDVITYVENGVADLGIVGSDVMEETALSVYELMDLGFGFCKFSIAAPKNQLNLLDKANIKVATKYPNVTNKYFRSKNKTIKVIPLKGSVELAPLAGLADCIVDIVETGNTLKANDLVIIKDLADVSARLICNKVSFRFNKNKIIEIVERLKVAS